MKIRKFAARILLLITVLVPAALFLPGCFGQTEEEQKAAAWNFMAQSVTVELGNPGGLTFPLDVAEGVTPLGNNRFQITSFADFTNEKGENKRFYFYGIVAYASNAWTLETLKFSE